MQFSTTRSTVVSVSAALVVATAGIVGGAAGATNDVVIDPAGDVPAMEAPAYTGDPWEKRFREQFWSTQHIHDSWNKCHIGEEVPQRLQRETDCWSRVPGHTDR